MPFDPRRLVPTGRPVPVLEKIMSSTGGEAPSDGSAQIDVSASGFCAYRTGENETVYRLAVVDRKGTVLKKAAAPRGFSWARFAPDGNRAAVVISSGTQSDVWVYDVARDAFSKLTFEGDNQTVVWSPDGRDVAFTSDRSLGLVTSPGGSPCDDPGRLSEARRRVGSAASALQDGGDPRRDGLLAGRADARLPGDEARDPARPRRDAG